MKKSVMCGGVKIGGGANVSIQSMTNTDTRDVKATLRQIKELSEAGCEIVRLAIPDFEAVGAFKEIKKLSKVPLVADIHFDYRLAIESIKSGADKIRINPGNIGGKENIKLVVNAAKERKIPIRVGGNSGSLSKELLDKHGGVTPLAMAESAVESIEVLEELGFEDIVISIKSSNLKMNYEAYKLIYSMRNYPLHIGLTEAGIGERGKIKSAVGIGALLLEGIGDTLRVSLTGNPVEEVLFAKELLKSSGILETGINLIACPTCGRTEVDLIKIANDLQKALKPIEKRREEEGKTAITVAVMGCRVNGPGEAKGADMGVACGGGKGAIFLRGEILKTVEESEITKEIIGLLNDFE